MLSYVSFLQLILLNYKIKFMQILTKKSSRYSYSIRICFLTNKTILILTNVNSHYTLKSHLFGSLSFYLILNLQALQSFPRKNIIP